MRNLEAIVEQIGLANTDRCQSFPNRNTKAGGDGSPGCRNTYHPCSVSEQREDRAKQGREHRMYQ